MKPTDHNFAILPWEYRGSGCDTTPHAITSLEIAGQKRHFLLKMRDGIIYFKDPKRAPIFAIPHHFEAELRGNELVSAWRTEMERENFGLFFWRPLSVLDYSTATIIAAIVRSDFSGWLTDALHIKWLEIPGHRDRKVFDIWKGSRKKVVRRTIERARNVLIDRAVHEGECQPLPSHWFSGSEAELERILSLVMQLYVRRSGPDSRLTCALMATNFASQGGFSNSFNPLYHPDLCFSSALPALLHALQQQFVWVAMEWKCSSTNLNRAHPLLPMKEKWGDEWRGNYSAWTPTLTITVPLVDSLSQHQKLELSFQLRDWLDGKVSPRQSANWLSQALD